MDTDRIYPSDIAPPGFIPGDPDPMEAFEPVPNGEQQPEPAIPPIESADIPEPAPPEAPRPLVRYLSAGGQRAYTLLFPLHVEGYGELHCVFVDPPSTWDVQDFVAGHLIGNTELMARMTNLDPAVLGAMRWPDQQALIDIVLPMLPEFIREQLAKGD